MKIKKTARRRLLYKDQLFCIVLNDNLLAIIVAASLANTESEVGLAALRTLNDIGRCLKLPYVRSSLHLSCMRCFSLRNCHC